MKLLTLKRELEQLKVIVRIRRGSGCCCEYIEVVEGQETTTEQELTLRRNRECYERNNDRNAHVGFSSITVPEISRGILTRQSIS